MKRFFLTIFLLTFSSVLYAQKDVTQFLGIPVDGSKAEMIQKLKEKGYASSQYDKDILVGRFNGTDVNIYVVTNNDKVFRIMVCDANAARESSIKIRFNRLCQQFLNNGKYLPASFSESDYTLPEDENIGYEMLVNKKRYEAAFYQNPKVDSLALAEEMQAFILSKYTETELSNPTDELQKDIKTALTKYALEKITKKSVWFMIDEQNYGEYRIIMYYDNVYNQANGEDL